MNGSLREAGAESYYQMLSPEPADTLAATVAASDLQVDAGTLHINFASVAAV